MSQALPKVALITGGAKRIGAAVARKLHAEGFNIALHYRSSEQAAVAVCDELCTLRADSAYKLQADLTNTKQLKPLVEKAIEMWGRLDLLLNNASDFYPTPVGNIDEDDWTRLIGSNLKAPLFLSQAATPYLRKTHGAIINMADIYAERPMKEHVVYNIAKAGLVMMTKTLARELGPEIRVNGIAPGMILWPDNDYNDPAKRPIVESTALKRLGDPEDIARTVLFLAENAPYITGHIIKVDGGRSLHI